MATEQERALEYRRQQQAREENKLARERALVGNPNTRRQLQLAWDPIRRWRGWDPIRRVKGEEE